MIPEDKCPKCGEQMERGISEYGQICPACMYYADDPFWSMQGEFIEPNGEAIPNPRAAEIPLYDFVRELKESLASARTLLTKLRSNANNLHPTHIAHAEGLVNGLETAYSLASKHYLVFEHVMLPNRID